MIGRNRTDIDGERRRVEGVAPNGELIVDEVEQIAVGPRKQPTSSNAERPFGPPEQKVRFGRRRLGDRGRIGTREDGLGRCTIGGDRQSESRQHNQAPRSAHRLLTRAMSTHSVTSGTRPSKVSAKATSRFHARTSALDWFRTNALSSRAVSGRESGRSNVRLTSRYQRNAVSYCEVADMRRDAAHPIEKTGQLLFVHARAALPVISRLPHLCSRHPPRTPLLLRRRRRWFTSP